MITGLIQSYIHLSIQFINIYKHIIYISITMLGTKLFLRCLFVAYWQFYLHTLMVFFFFFPLSASLLTMHKPVFHNKQFMNHFKKISSLSNKVSYSQISCTNATWYITFLEIHKEEFHTKSFAHSCRNEICLKHKITLYNYFSPCNAY